MSMKIYIRQKCVNAFGAVLVSEVVHNQLIAELDKVMDPQSHVMGVMYDSVTNEIVTEWSGDRSLKKQAVS